MFKHPGKVCMTYFQHFKFSMEMSKHLFIGSWKAFVHSIHPDIYITSTSDCVKLVSKRLNESGCRKED